MWEAVLIGLVGGFVAGLMGIGGGVVFVPGLVVLLDLSQQKAEGTSLLAIVPVAVVGAWSHYRHGELRLGEGLLLGLLALAGVAGGVVVANLLSAKALQIAFALLLLYTAYQMVRDALRGRSLRGPREGAES